MPTITLKSNDGKHFVVDVEVAKKFSVVKATLDILGFDEDKENIIALPQVNSTVLEKIIEWGTHHKDDPPVTENNDNVAGCNHDISPWDMEFLKVDDKLLVAITVAAYYLDIQGLYNPACKICALRLPEIFKDKGVSEALKMLST